MIGKQEKGRSFRGCLKYVFEKQGSQFLGGNMLGETVDELTAEFNVARRLNPNLDVVVYHAMLAVSAQERQSDARWLEIASKYLEGMGFGNSQFVAVRHTDEEHDHIHIVSCRVSLPNAETVSDSNDYRRSEDLIRELERSFGLQAVTPSYEQLERSPTTGEVRRFEKQKRQFEEGKRSLLPDPPVRMVLQSLISNLSEDQPTLPTLIHQLQACGVEVKRKMTEQQKWGISYGFNGEHYSGTQLGKAYTFQGLQRHLGIGYENERDDTAIDAMVNRADQHTLPMPMTVGSFQLDMPSTHVVRATCAAQERLIPQVRCQEAKKVAKTLTCWLEAKQVSEFEGQHYRVQFNESDQSLVLTRKNGQNLLCQQMGYVVHVALKDSDVAIFQPIYEQLTSHAATQPAPHRKSSFDLEME